MKSNSTQCLRTLAYTAYAFAEKGQDAGRQWVSEGGRLREGGHLGGSQWSSPSLQTPLVPPLSVFSKRRMVHPAFRQKRKVERAVTCLLLLNCLQLRIIFMSKRHVLG